MKIIIKYAKGNKKLCPGVMSVQTITNQTQSGFLLD